MKETLKHILLYNLSTMPEMLLRDAFIEPTETVLKDMLEDVYAVYKKLQQLTPELSYDWHYYKDSKGWLCKVSYKKRTVFWLSVREGFFKTSFFFLERHLEGIAALGIKAGSFSREKEWGKMIPFIFDVSSEKQLPDLLKMIEFKKKAK